MDVLGTKMIVLKLLVVVKIWRYTKNKWNRGRKTTETRGRKSAEVFGSEKVPEMRGRLHSCVPSNIRKHGLVRHSFHGNFTHLGVFVALGYIREDQLFRQTLDCNLADGRVVVVLGDGDEGCLSRHKPHGCLPNRRGMIVSCDIL